MRPVMCVLLVVAALLTNVNYALTAAIRINLTVVPPLIVVLIAHRFGRRAGAMAGALVALPWVGLAIALGVTDLATRFSYGPLLVPHSSLEDLVRLALLGYCAGWLFDQVHVAATRISLAATPPGRSLGGWWWALPAAVAILAADLIFPIGPWDRRAWLPTSSVALVACAAAAFALGPRAGTVAGALAGVAATLMYPITVMARMAFSLDLAATGHILSLAVLGRYAGRAGLLRLNRDRIGQLASQLGWRVGLEGKHPAWHFVPLLVLFSIDVRIVQGKTWMVPISLHPLLVVTALLAGVLCGGRAVRTVGITMTLLTLAAPLIVYAGLVQAIPLGSVRAIVQLDASSAVNVAVLTGAAWAGAQVDLRGCQRNRFMVAIAIFTAFEVAAVLETGRFLSPYGRLVLGGVELSLGLSLLRLLQPWFVVTLLRLALKRGG